MAMAAELSIAVAVAGLVGVSVTGLVDKMQGLKRRFDHANSKFKDHSKPLRENLDYAVKVLQTYKQLEEVEINDSQPTRDDGLPKRALELAIDILSHFIDKANAYLDKLDEKSKTKIFFTAKDIEKEFTNLKGDLQLSLSLMTAAFQPEVTNKMQMEMKEMIKGKCIFELSFRKA